MQTEVKLRTHAQFEHDRASTEAIEGTRVKAAFLANMSHELRTPMNAIVGLTDLVLRDQLPPAQRENLETVRESSHGLLDDLLDLSKIEAGAMRFDAVDFSLRDVLSQLERLRAPRAQEPVEPIDGLRTRQSAPHAQHRKFVIDSNAARGPAVAPARAHGHHAPVTFSVVPAPSSASLR